MRLFRLANSFSFSTHFSHELRTILENLGTDSELYLPELNSELYSVEYRKSHLYREKLYLPEGLSPQREN